MSDIRSDISFEIFHPYLSENLSEEELGLRVEMASYWALPLLDAWRKRGLTVSTSVLIDNISGTDSAGDQDTVSMRESLTEKFSLHGVQIDYFCDEGDLNTSASWLASHLTPIPKKGDGAFGGNVLESLEKGYQRYLIEDSSHGDVSETARYADHKFRGTRAFDVRRSIGISTPIYRRNPNEQDAELVYSCPTLASWWQILRLGGLADPEISKNVAGDLTHDQKKLDGTFQKLFKVGNDAAPFCAHQTVSLLDPKYIAVEHAVRSILSLTDFPETFSRTLAKSADVANFSIVDDRISYVFSIPLKSKMAKKG